MTTATRKGPAERLYLLFANHKVATDSMWLEADFLLTEALAVERRATVERIRAGSVRQSRYGLGHPTEVYLIPVAILDEEAAR